MVWFDYLLIGVVGATIIWFVKDRKEADKLNGVHHYSGFNKNKEESEKESYTSSADSAVVLDKHFEHFDNLEINDELAVSGNGSLRDNKDCNNAILNGIDAETKVGDCHYNSSVTDDDDHEIRDYDLLLADEIFSSSDCQSLCSDNSLDDIKFVEDYSDNGSVINVTIDSHIYNPDFIEPNE
ncbi:Hypothetical protein CINCED_3A015097 [Cinara cedri]|uniref:Uncharacterized protein n=1 Tax=Cinara cedri TaxID=506608 RepID=A0A5E4MUB6_9HEMI|nr:Hypothetical protein CINCED_3A015097 [Cinara cedri]